jgi:hypothetical protein
MTNLWTKSETTGPSSKLVIEYKITNNQNQVEQKSVTLTSTTNGTSTSTYTALSYTDRDGKPQSSEVLTRKVDRTRNTIAAVNPGYVAWRLGKRLGLPSGDAISENITTSEYITTVDGPVLKTETSDQYVSMSQFSGGLQLEEWGSFRPSGGELILSHRTIRRMDYSKTSDGRDVTRTRTERYIAAAESSEWKNYAAKRGKEIKSLVTQFPEAIEPFVRAMVPLVYEGTEVQIETGRIPVPQKPPDQDIARDSVTNGSGDRPSDVTPAGAYGNNKGWTSYIPDAGTDGNWQNYNTDSNNDGVPDWNEYVPQSWEDYDSDSDSDGTFDWEPYVPQDFTDYDRDSNGDGVPDWADSVPTTWPEFDADTDNDGVPDWAPFVPTQWEDFTGDSSGDGVPDWAPFVPVQWPAFDQDTDSDGVPDWAPFVPTGWESFDRDTTSDGIPDWAPFVPTGWESFDQDTDSDGVPDWAPFVPGDWQELNQDTDNDGVPDWAPFVPQSWTEYNQDTDSDGVPDWAPFVPQTWEDWDQDTSGDGIPDWAPFVPQTWEDWNKDTDSDGVPDWQPYIPTTWEDFDQDSDNDGIPDWQPYIPTDWTDYNRDTDGDGVPDWAPYVPTGTDFDTDSDSDGIPDWAPFVPTGPDDFDTSDSDFTTTETEVSNDKVLTGVVLFNGSAFNPDDTTVTASYDMPFAPDDYFEYVKGIRKLIPGGATAAAQAFGRTESALDVGHAYGQNIVTGWNEAPTLDLSPVYVQLAGIEGAFLMDSSSYAWGPEGMVVSSDLMLLGVSGWYGSSQPTTSWVRVPVPVAGLQQVSAGTAGVGVKANSIVLPADFSARNPGPVLAALPSNGSDRFALYRGSQGLVAPTLELEQIRLATGPLLIVREFNYELTVEPEVAAIATGPVAEGFTAARPPAAVISAATFAPVVLTGAVVAAPPVVVSTAVAAPAVAGGDSVDVPMAAVTVAALMPDLVGRQRAQVVVPAGEVNLAGFVPVVITPALVAVPTLSLTVAALAPEILIGPVDPDFANVALLLHMDGTAGSSSFTDSGPLARPVTNTSGVNISTAIAKFSGGSGFFSGGALQASATGSAIGDSDFTAEAWVRTSGTSSYRAIIALRTDNTYEYNIYVSSGTFAIWINDDNRCASAAISANTWYHVAVTRTSGVVRLFVDGVKSVNDYNDSTSIPDTATRIGSNGLTSGGEIFTGYMDDVRITVGVSRYQSDFTPPTAPFPDA